jgi:hypothetical protein
MAKVLTFQADWTGDETAFPCRPSQYLVEDGATCTVDLLGYALSARQRSWLETNENVLSWSVREK